MELGSPNLKQSALAASLMPFKRRNTPRQPPSGGAAQRVVRGRAERANEAGRKGGESVAAGRSDNACYKAMKKVLMICVLLISLGVIELLREQVTYYRYAKQLEKGHAKLQIGMHEKEVLFLLSKPDLVRPSESGKTCYWDAGERQGYLFNKLNLVSQKGHYTLTVSFDNKQTVIRTWAGVN